MSTVVTETLRHLPARVFQQAQVTVSERIISEMTDAISTVLGSTGARLNV